MSPGDLIDDVTYYLNVSVRSSNYFVRPRQHIRLRALIENRRSQKPAKR
jgi:hypothetical protein